MIPRDEGSPAFGSRRVFALAVLCSAWLMIVLDFFIVNVALPTIQEDLGFSRENLQWVVSSYSIAFGGFLLLGGGGRRISSADGGCSGPGSLSSRWSRSSAGLRGRGACCSPPVPAAAGGAEADAAAITAGYRYAFGVGAGFAAAGLLAALFVLPRRGHRESDAEERQE